MNLVYIQSGSILLQAKHGHHLVMVRILLRQCQQFKISVSRLNCPFELSLLSNSESHKVFKEWAILILCAMHALFPLILRFSFTKYHSQKFNFEF